MRTKTKLTLEQTQQGVSDEVLVSIEGVEESKRKVKIMVKRKKPSLHLGRNRVNTYAIRNTKLLYGDQYFLLKQILMDENKLKLQRPDFVLKEFISQTDDYIITEGQILGKTSMVHMDDFCIDEDQHGSVRSIGVAINGDVADFGSKVPDNGSLGVYELWKLSVVSHIKTIMWIKKECYAMGSGSGLWNGERLQGVGYGSGGKSGKEINSDLILGTGVKLNPRLFLDFTHAFHLQLIFDDVVKEAWSALSNTDGDRGPLLSLNSKIKGLKSQLKSWFSQTKANEISRKKSALASLEVLDEKIDVGQANKEEKVLRVNTWYELDNLEKLDSKDLFHKARVRWDVEGDENSKFFHGIINSKRNTQKIQGIMQDGVWISEPNAIKSAFLNLYKQKFSCHDSMVNFPPMAVVNRLSDSDDAYLDSMVSLQETKNVVWDCGSQKAPRPDYGPLILSEVIDWYKRRKKKMLLFKVDFEKAFDSVSWRFLDHVMDKLGFSSSWRRWIKAGLLSSRASILINGSPTTEFSLKRGLRQGDPLSPFLFIIIMEGLHVALKDGLSTNMFRGVNVGSPSIRLSHLFYADDVIIFSDWNQQDMDNIIHILNIFYLASGLRISINKSNLYGVGVSHSEVNNMAAGIGCSLSGWKANLLPSGGRLTLIKSVLGSLGIYFLSIFKALEVVIKVLESLRASFFWGATAENRKLAWVKWSSILAPLEKDPSALWVNVLKSIHGEEAGFELSGCQTSGLWDRIVGLIYQLHSSSCIPLNTFRFNAGDGPMFRFWKDVWLGDQPLCVRYNRLFYLERNRNFLIRDRIVNGSWSLDWCRPVTRGRSQAGFNNLMVDISLLNIEDGSDSMVFSLSSDSIFSVSVARKHIDDFNSHISLPCTRWFKIIPRKVNIFMWRLFLDKLPHRFNLSARGVDIASIMCLISNGHVEVNSHIFFSCTTASTFWRIIRGWCDHKFPLFSSCADWDNWFSSWSASKDERDWRIPFLLLLVGFCSVLETMWFLILMS
uniref:Reverse transcriptase domain, reverse transcriptase zinc-binding domain protein n=1 Tax=Tanacetum cinerariifolium TaxID=118510 RepID=A0A6L2M041_TANCI|nr:reverse transcriptase domain, reverse transcriptase zinc-binding domain protein [Tanacetum cinerariifolium]